MQLHAPLPCVHKGRCLVQTPLLHSSTGSRQLGRTLKQCQRPRNSSRAAAVVAMGSGVDEMKPPFSTDNTKQTAPGAEHQMNPRPDYGYDSYKGNGKLKGLKALVTGADSGIGRAIALAFAREGADVAIGYLNEDQDAKETQQAVEECGVKSILLPGDLSHEETCKEYVEKTVSELGGIDILVNNASFQGEATEWTEIPRDRLDFTFKTNIVAMISLAQKAVKHMKKGSAIINVGSIQAYQPMDKIIDYASTKGAITTFTKGIAPPCMEKGIRVNAIAPGPVWTPLVVQSFPPELIKDFGANMAPAGRPGQPAEYGPPAVFLACERDSSYVSGSILGVTGGMPLN